MAGEAQTGKFMFGTATVMVGPQANALNLNPSSHSLGLVKNFSMTRDSNYVELGQGIRNDVVESVQNEETLTVSWETYEMTGKNLAYAAGLNGTDFTNGTGNPLAVASAPSSTTVALSAAPGGAIAANDWIYIQEGLTDQVVLARVASISGSTLTLTAATAIPGGFGFTTAARVGRVDRIVSRDSIFQPYFAVKIVAQFPQDGRPLTILFPKVKITRGLSINLNRDDFSNMPMEITPYMLLPSDTGYTVHGATKYVIGAS